MLTPSTPRARRVLRRFSLLAVILLGLATSAWAYACHRLESNLVSIAEANGWHVASASTHWGGWPFSAALDLERATAATEGLTWAAERARAAISAARPMQLDVSAEGQQSISVAGLPTSRFTARRTLVLIDLGGAAPTRLSLAGLHAALPAGPAEVETAEAAVAPDGLRLEAVGIDLPLLGVPIQRLGLSVRVTPAIQPGETARAWRAAGGRAQIAVSTLQSGPLSATARAEVKLDERLQPDGDGTITAQGVNAWLGRLGETGTLTGSAVTAAKAVVAILSIAPGGGPLTLPVTLRQGLLAIAGMPVARLLPLAW